MERTIYVFRLGMAARPEDIENRRIEYKKQVEKEDGVICLHKEDDLTMYKVQEESEPAVEVTDLSGNEANVIATCAKVLSEFNYFGTETINQYSKALKRLKLCGIDTGNLQDCIAALENEIDYYRKRVEELTRKKK